MAREPRLMNGCRACGRNGREPDLLKHMIGRGRQVGRGVDERAVEIEDDGAVAEVGVHRGSLEWREARTLLLFQHPVTAGFEFAAFGNSSRNSHR